MQNAEQHLKEKGFSCKWDENGGLFFWQVLPAFRTHHETKERVWFNQADLHHTSYLKDSPMFVGQELPDHLYPYHTYYGDGSEIEPDPFSISEPQLGRMLWDFVGGMGIFW